MLKRCNFYEENNGNHFCRMNGSGIDNEIYESFCKKEELENCPVNKYYHNLYKTLKRNKMFKIKKSEQ